MEAARGRVKGSKREKEREIGKDRAREIEGEREIEGGRENKMESKRVGGREL